MGYFRDTVKGIAWVAGLRGFTRGMAFVRIAIIARLLSPAQFGLFDIAVLVLAFIEILAETGINVFLVQKEEIEKYISTAWIVSILRGGCISICILLFALPVALFFNAPKSFLLLILISVVPFIRGFINPAEVFFQKDLKFHKEFYFRSTIFFIDTLFSIFFVFTLRSPIGIIIGLVMGALSEVLLSFMVIKIKPKFLFDKHLAKEIFHKGKWVTFSGIFNYLYHNFDDVVVGKVTGIGALGLYGMAYNISTLPISEVADVVSRVTFPVYVKISGDRDRLKSAYFKTIIFVTVLSVPLGILCIIFPREIIYVILGNKWLAAAPALQVLGFFGIIRSISGTSSALFLSVHKQKYVAIVTFISFAALAIPIVPLVSSYGIVGAAISSVIGAVAALPIMIFYTRKVLYTHEKS